MFGLQLLSQGLNLFVPRVNLTVELLDLGLQLGNFLAELGHTGLERAVFLGQFLSGLLFRLIQLVRFCP